MVTTRLLKETSDLKDNAGYGHVISLIEKRLQAVENELELMNSGADRTLALAGQFSGYRAALSILRGAPDEARSKFEAWVETHQDSAALVVQDMASYDIE